VAGQKRRLILFARLPVAGKVKTRLIPALGAEGTAALHRRLVLRALRTAHALCRSQDVELEIRFAGDNANEMQHWLGDNWRYRPQCEGDLGQRMAGAFADSFREGSSATVVIGSDCPSLTHEILALAFKSLQSNPIVFGPANDGGYYLAGLTRLLPGLFQDIAWGTATVLAHSLEKAARLGNKPGLLQPLDDIDRPKDLAHWQRLVEVDEKDLSRVSVGQPGVVAGSFAFRIAEPFTGRWLVEWTTNLRSRWLQNPYGDQAQFMRRSMFEELGGDRRISPRRAPSQAGQVLSPFSELMIYSEFRGPTFVTKSRIRFRETRAAASHRGAQTSAACVLLPTGQQEMMPAPFFARLRTSPHRCGNVRRRI
jgi:uncharacterized protein